MSGVVKLHSRPTLLKKLIIYLVGQLLYRIKYNLTLKVSHDPNFSVNKSVIRKVENCSKL